MIPVAVKLPGVEILPVVAKDPDIVIPVPFG